MTPMLRWRLAISLVGFVIWAAGARAERDGASWGGMMMTAGLVILGIAFLMRFMKPRVRDDRPTVPPAEPPRAP